MNPQLNPFSQSKDADRWEAAGAGRLNPRRVLQSIEPTGTAQVRCIRVAAQDQLYVTKDYIVTHNTTLAEIIAVETGGELTCVTGPSIDSVQKLTVMLSHLHYGAVFFIDEALAIDTPIPTPAGNGHHRSSRRSAVLPSYICRWEQHCC